MQSVTRALFRRKREEERITPSQKKKKEEQKSTKQSSKKWNSNKCVLYFRLCVLLPSFRVFYSLLRYGHLVLSTLSMRTECAFQLKVNHSCPKLEEKCSSDEVASAYVNTGYKNDIIPSPYTWYIHKPIEYSMRNRTAKQKRNKPCVCALDALNKEWENKHKYKQMETHITNQIQIFFYCLFLAIAVLKTRWLIVSIFLLSLRYWINGSHNRYNKCFFPHVIFINFCELFGRSSRTRPVFFSFSVWVEIERLVFEMEVARMQST